MGYRPTPEPVLLARRYTELQRLLQVDGDSSHLGIGRPWDVTEEICVRSPG